MSVIVNNKIAKFGANGLRSFTDVTVECQINERRVLNNRVGWEPVVYLISGRY